MHLLETEPMTLVLQNLHDLDCIRATFNWKTNMKLRSCGIQNVLFCHPLHRCPKHSDGLSCIQIRSVCTCDTSYLLLFMLVPSVNCAWLFLFMQNGVRVALVLLCGSNDGRASCTSWRSASMSDSSLVYQTFVFCKCSVNGLSKLLFFLDPSRNTSLKNGAWARAGLKWSPWKDWDLSVKII